MRRLLPLLGLVLLVGSVRAEPKPKAKPANPKTQDLIFFDEGRPLMIRLHLVSEDGEPAMNRWSGYIGKWFDHLDRSGNGSLNEEEFGKAPSVTSLATMARQFGLFRAVGQGPPLDAVDTNDDKKISKREFEEYYRDSTAGPFQVTTTNIRYQNSTASTQQLIAALDENGDGKITKKEAERASITLRKFDTNDDETLTTQEIQPLTTIRNIGGLGRNPRMGMMGQGANVSPVVLVPHEKTGSRLEGKLRIASEVFKRLDKNKDNKLSRDEFRLPQKAFDDLDRNKNKTVGTLELLRWIIVKPDIEATVRFGKTNDPKSGIEVVTKKNSDSGVKIESSSPDTITFSTGTNQVHLTLPPALANPNQRFNYTRTYMTQFQQADPENTGVVKAKKLADRRYYYLRNIATMADRNLDGDLTKQEMENWIELTTSGMNLSVKLTYVVQGSGLFGVLDANQDGRLSIRETKNVWKQLTKFDSDKDNIFTADDVPRQTRLLLAMDNSGTTAAYRYAQPGTYVRPGTPRNRTTGPTWFARMDRNSDGDISEREFLGTPEQFAELDLNKDEVIDPEEAKKAKK